MEIKYEWEFPTQHGAFSVEMVDFPASHIWLPEGSVVVRRFDGEMGRDHDSEFEWVCFGVKASKIDKLWTVDANSGASGNQLKGETCTKQNNDAISKDGHVLIVVYIKRT